MTYNYYNREIKQNAFAFATKKIRALYPITSSVWSKIYSTSLLKNAVKSIDIGLFFAEDMYLNICCFFGPLFRSICISPNAYYEWNLRFGFSSKKDSGKALLKDYDIVKPRIDQLLRQNNVCSDVFYIFHLESLYFMRALLVSVYDKKIRRI